MTRRLCIISVCFCINDTCFCIANVCFNITKRLCVSVLPAPLSLLPVPFSILWRYVLVLTVPVCVYICLFLYYSFVGVLLMPVSVSPGTCGAGMWKVAGTQPYSSGQSALIWSLVPHPFLRPVNFDLPCPPPPPPPYFAFPPLFPKGSPLSWEN